MGKVVKSSRYYLLRGENKSWLDRMPKNYVDSVVTDPPYGINFMGNHWDYDVPSVETWKKVKRVLKPGGYMVAFFSTRTYHRGVIAIEDAGFRIVDTIAWLYGTGFPKSVSVSKAMRSKDASKEMIDSWEGWGTALKPAMELIVLARKPHKGTIADNVLKYKAGALNIDACRVPLVGTVDARTFDNNHRVSERLPKSMNGTVMGLHGGGWKNRVGAANVPSARFPANVIHDGSKEVVKRFPISNSARAKGNPNNPKRGSKHSATSYGLGDDRETHDFRDSGSAARFFFCAKASRKDRDEGLDTFVKKVAPVGATGLSKSPLSKGNRDRRHTPRSNTHPTVKPTSLMRWLVRLITPKGGKCLDPYMGSGSTGKACLLEGMFFIGMEREKEHFTTARYRILWAKKQTDLVNAPGWFK
jgi:site-specific DNA-methyltransferase (adenine-specific)